jgi:hypothetical protein
MLTKVILPTLFKLLFFTKEFFEPFFVGNGRCDRKHLVGQALVIFLVDVRANLKSIEVHLLIFDRELQRLYIRWPLGDLSCRVIAKHRVKVVIKSKFGPGRKFWRITLWRIFWLQLFDAGLKISLTFSVDLEQKLIECLLSSNLLVLTGLQK